MTQVDDKRRIAELEQEVAELKTKLDAANVLQAAYADETGHLTRLCRQSHMLLRKLPFWRRPHGYDRVMEELADCVL